MQLFSKFRFMEDLEEKVTSTILKVAEKIKKLRKEKGYTSYETFAFEFEINRVQYWRVEKGSNITLKTLIKILAVHDLSLEEFFKDI